MAQPTRQMVEEHSRTHAPYRPWCKHCVENKAAKPGQGEVDHAGDEDPVVSIDYFFMSSDDDMV